MRQKRTVTNHQAQDRAKTYQSIQQDAKTGEPVKWWPTEDEQIPLFPGSTQTVLDILIPQFAQFVDSSGQSQQSLSRIISDYKQAIDIDHPENNYPKDYQQALAFISKYLTPTDTYDICVNDCVVFRTYSEERDYKDNNFMLNFNGRLIGQVNSGKKI